MIDGMIPGGDKDFECSFRQVGRGEVQILPDHTRAGGIAFAQQGMGAALLQQRDGQLPDAGPGVFKMQFEGTGGRDGAAVGGKGDSRGTGVAEVVECAGADGDQQQNNE